MALYAFHDLALEVKQEDQEAAEDLAQLLQNLSFVRSHTPARKPSLCLSVSRTNNGLKVPWMAREVFREDGFRGLEVGVDFYLSDGSSVFYLQPFKGQGEAQVAPSFFHKPPILQRNFWAFGLLKLLRPLGIYSLHAAGAVTPKGLGLLIIGESGGGKSTLIVSLIRRGWSYLSDDAVLLCLQPEGVKALAFRKNFYVNADEAAAYSDLPLGEEVPDTSGRQRRRVCIEEAYFRQYVPGCLPRVLLFSRIVPHRHSSLRTLDRLSALENLLAQSGPQLFDRNTMPQHLQVLKELVQQSTTYELRAGLDLYREPGKLEQLLTRANRARQWAELL